MRARQSKGHLARAREVFDVEMAALKNVRAQLDEVTFNEAWAAGRALTMVQAIQLAMSEG